MIPQETIEEIRHKASIVGLISEYLNLKKRGNNHIGLCPFHSEKTPSFTASDEKQIFYCFGCHATGNIFTFLMKHDNLSFVEAVKAVAEKVGVKIREDKRSPLKPNRQEAIYKANTLAADYFHRQLLGRKGVKARDYLKNRGVDDAIAEEFKLGYASQSWDGLIDFLSKADLPLEVAFTAGLVMKKEHGGYYDRFRDRIICPILDIKGRAIAFGGRTMSNGVPKYLNSPESPIFRKGEILYGMYNARQAISQKSYVIAVEGYFDLMTLQRYGFKNSVATMGTAITPSHIKGLRGHAKEVYMLFDGDEAGKKAVTRVLPLFLDEAYPVKVVFMPNGMDPDDFLNREGPEALDILIKKAEPLMDYFLKSLKETSDLSVVEGKMVYLDTVIPYLSKIKNVAARGHYAGIIASVIGLGTDVVYKAIKNPKGIGRKGVPTPSETISIKTSSRAEEKILKVIISDPRFYNETVKKAIDAFKNQTFGTIGRYIIELLEKGAETIDAAALSDSDIDEKANKWLAMSIIREDGAIKDDPEKILEDCCKKVLDAGKLSDGTVRLIRQLEDAERFEEAELIRAGAEAYSPKR